MHLDFDQAVVAVWHTYQDAPWGSSPCALEACGCCLSVHRKRPAGRFPAWVPRVRSTTLPEHSCEQVAQSGEGSSPIERANMQLFAGQRRLPKPHALEHARVVLSQRSEAVFVPKCAKLSCGGRHARRACDLVVCPSQVLCTRSCAPNRVSSSGFLLLLQEAHGP